MRFGRMFFYDQDGGGGAGGPGGAGGAGDAGGSGGGAGAESDWKTGLPEDLRSEKTFLSIKGKDWAEAGPVLAKQYLESQKYNVGALRIPKEDAKPEEWTAFYQKLGKPAKPEDYGIARPADLPASVEWDDNLAKWFSTTAHKVNMPKAMAQAFMGEWNALASASAAEKEKKENEALQPLRQEWGKTFDGKLELAVRAVSHFGGAEFAKYLKESGLGNDPRMIRTFAPIGKMLMEAGFIAGDGAGGALSKDSIQAKIDEINNNKDHPYWDETKAGHKEAVAHMTELFRQRDA